jgi:hypothetical protein
MFDMRKGNSVSGRNLACIEEIFLFTQGATLVGGVCLEAMSLFAR